MKKYSGKSSNATSEDVVAFIPVRGGSKGIPLKNIKLFCGMPLVYWTIKAAVESNTIDKVYVATESEEIMRVVDSFQFEKVEIFYRSAESATDEASTEMVMLEFAEQVIFKEIFLIQATSPLLKAHNLTEAFEQYKKQKADSLLSVVVQKRFQWKEEGGSFVPVNYNPQERPRRQEWDGYLVENGSFYLTERSKLIESKCRVSGNISAYIMDEDSYFEIDEPSDWIIMESIFKKQQIINNDILSNINLLICDVDGVLTDAGMYYSENGDELKKFNTKDGKGIELLKASGVEVMILTSEDRTLVQRRAEKLKVDYLYMGIKDKKVFLDAFFQNNKKFNYPTTAYIGDDVNDLQCLEAVAFSSTPSDAVPEVLAKVNYICTKKGGHGCVREICDILIRKEIIKN
ncbi:acylneuraminate cytidylyltransferase [Paenibacillus sp. HN-1]|uniref:acylneuraminate cytidylyltransferase n=1 Tax=Paenibacillus TaxID=44249 RepID=UPI001CA91B7B|nr:MULTISPECIES: acylneuraminate cytidylyltransferase [Paenibacillus]MBY9077598.1 acylneuraminate cytidylyltransferase [Paenibacillus sp. CGMCC 1.18879]MBY9087869.1 acylneuraminate cytidylyltransferase [Paenibacillus sinensis]